MVDLVITSGILALIAGIVILIWPTILNSAIGIYLILISLLQVFF